MKSAKPYKASGRRPCRPPLQHRLRILLQLSPRPHRGLPGLGSRSPARRLRLRWNGPVQGGQAEFVLVPYADFNALKLPGEPGDEWEDDFLLLSDVFPTAFHATELACVSTGKTVAVFGAGPVGLLSAHCALLKGASEVYVVDSIPERLQKAEELGATSVDTRRAIPSNRYSLSARKTKASLKACVPEKKR